VLVLLGVQLVQQIAVSHGAETAKVCTRAYMVTADEKSYMLTFSSLKGDDFQIFTVIEMAMLISMVHSCCNFCSC